nr:DUF4397 domain-containing protein [Corallococcus exiguus]
MLVVGLASALAGCDSAECVDSFDCRDKGAAPAGQVWKCQEEKCVAVTSAPPPDAGTETDAGTQPDSGTDAGVDAGTQTDAGVDAGTDAGVDAGVDAGTEPDAGTQTDAGVDAGTAYVRFVNVLFEGNSSEPNTPWVAATYRMDLSLGDAAPLFSGVEPGDSAVTDFIPVAPGTDLTFRVRNTGKPATEAALATLQGVSLAEGEHVTVLALGLMSRVGTVRFDTPKLLALRDETLGAPGVGEARLRHVTADRVVAASRPRFIRTDSGLDLPNVAPFTADTEVLGHVIPVASTTRLLVRGSNDNPAPSQSGELAYTLPSGGLTSGTAYYAVSFGDDRRAMNDPAAPSLLLIPGGKDGAVRLKRDPLLYFFHALDSGAPLKALSQGVPVAADFQFGADPKPGDLPASAAGHPLSFVLQSDGVTSVLDGAQTGPLEAGRRYLVVVSGRAGGTGALAPKAFVVPDSLPSDAQDARVRFVNACPTSPVTGASLGFFDVAGDGIGRGNTFTPVIPDVAYGASGGPAEGAVFPAPTGTDVTGSYVYYAVRGTVGAASQSRSVKGLPLARPHLFLLMGDWEAGLTFRAFNLRSNTWSVLTPRGEDVFQP